MADGCDGFEFDVRLTADGEAVVCHDPRVGRIEIAQASAAQLHGLPRLEEVLARFHTRAFLDIELKVGALERLTASLLRKHQPVRGVVVSSFLPEVLRAVRAKDASIPLGLICETREELQFWKELPVEYLVPHFSLLNKGFAAEAMSAGKKILVWTVNDPKEMVRCRDMCVEGIISDETASLHRTLSNAHGGKL